MPVSKKWAPKRIFRCSWKCLNDQPYIKTAAIFFGVFGAFVLAAWILNSNPHHTKLDISKSALLGPEPETPCVGDYDADLTNDKAVIRIPESTMDRVSQRWCSLTDLTVQPAPCIKFPLYSDGDWSGVVRSNFSDTPDVETLCKDWQSSRHSQQFQFTSPRGTDWFLWHHLGRYDPPNRKGIYLDVTAGQHPMADSYTFFFDKCLNWKGACAFPADQPAAWANPQLRSCTPVKLEDFGRLTTSVSSSPSPSPSPSPSSSSPSAENSAPSASTIASDDLAGSDDTSGGDKIDTKLDCTTDSTNPDCDVTTTGSSSSSSDRDQEDEDEDKSTKYVALQTLAAAKIWRIDYLALHDIPTSSSVDELKIIQVLLDAEIQPSIVSIQSTTSGRDALHLLEKNGYNILPGSLGTGLSRGDRLAFHPDLKAPCTSFFHHPDGFRSCGTPLAAGAPAQTMARCESSSSSSSASLLRSLTRRKTTMRVTTTATTTTAATASSAAVSSRGWDRSSWMMMMISIAVLVRSFFFQL